MILKVENNMYVKFVLKKITNLSIINFRKQSKFNYLQRFPTKIYDLKIFDVFATLLCLTFKQPVRCRGGLRVKVDADLIADSRAREGF